MRTDRWDCSNFREMTWKNGAGKTLELFNDQATADGVFALRMSIATITQSGPFSDFCGYERIITQLDGLPMSLFFTEKKTISPLELLTPFHFAGEDKVECQVSGRARDFNVMLKRDVFCGRMKFIEPERVCSASAHHQVFVYALSGSASSTNLTEIVTVREGELVRFSTQGMALELVTDANGKILLIAIDKC